jgi:hypothetical protein
MPIGETLRVLLQLGAAEQLGMQRQIVSEIPKQTIHSDSCLESVESLTNPEAKNLQWVTP